MSWRVEALYALAKAAKELANASAASQRVCDQRAALGTSGSRARMTTLNARWETLVDERARKQKAFSEALDRLQNPTYGGTAAMTAIIADDVETRCNPHPCAPHGFDRNGSHSADRYVCECEGWRPDRNCALARIGGGAA